ncbi:MAG TPA: ABC transporter ATP-binding protein [Chloroflexia bacterium]|nr:ABC transporter ATP-binding protein [Chloroflexia bacterium]
MAHNPGLYRTLLSRYLAPQRLRVVLLAVLLLGSIGLQLLNPQILRRFIDTVTGSGPQGGVAGIAALFLGLAIFQQVLSVGATWASERVAWSATNSLRADLALHCLRLDLSFHKARTPGELIERIDGDVTALANFFSQFVVQILGSVLLLLGVLAVLWTIDWRAGAALTVFAVVTLGAMLGLRTIATRFWKAYRQASAELFGFVEEHLAGTVDIRANGAQPYVMHRLYRFMRARFQTGRRARLASSIPWSIPSLAEALGIGIAFALAVSLYGAGSVSLGTAFVVYFYTQALFQPMHMLSNQLEDFQKASAGAIRVQELMSTRSALTDGSLTEFAPGAPAIEFRNVTFSYEGDDTVLRDLSFRVAPGEVLGLLGRTGSGKTTVTRLLLRLYDPTAGSITLGGVELRDAELAALRRQIGMVTQDVQLFRGSIRDNLTFFDDTVPEARIWEALESLGLVEWCRALPDGLDTIIEGGGGLSAGEAQLLAFTRVFLKDPGLVILDEASSRLDPVTERLVERAVVGLLRGRTGIIIAHRLSTVDRADTILILERGAIAEHGPRPMLVSDPASRFSQLLRTGVEEVLV